MSKCGPKSENGELVCVSEHVYLDESEEMVHVSVCF